MIKNIIITGAPGSGKSTILDKIISKIDNKVGFVTKEIREDGERKGFEIITSKGGKTLLAHVSFKSNIKVSKYGVKPENLDKIITGLEEFKDKDILYIDEIGQMELYSKNFKDLANRYLNSKNNAIFTLSKVYEDDFTKKVKERDDIIIIEITPENREKSVQFIEKILTKIEKAKSYIKEPSRFKIEKDKATLKSIHGTRTMILKNNIWQCDCDFFKENQICSHIITLKEVIKNWKQ